MQRPLLPLFSLFRLSFFPLPSSPLYPTFAYAPRSGPFKSSEGFWGGDDDDDEYLDWTKHCNFLLLRIDDDLITMTTMMKGLS